MSFVTFLSRHAALVLAVGVFAGLVLPGAASFLRPFLPLTVAALLVLSVMQTRYGELRASFRRPALSFAVVVFMLCALPVLTWAVLVLTGAPQSLRTPIILVAAAPPIMAAPAMALLLRLNASLMLVIVAASTVAAPFILGVVAEIFVAPGLRIDPAHLALRLAAFIFGCVVIAGLLRALIGAARIEKRKSILDVVGLVLLLTFAIAIMDGIGVRLQNETVYVLSVLGIAFVANVVFQFIGGATFVATGMRDALTIAYACGNRNIGLLLAVLPETSAPDTLLYFAVAQIPMYTLPAILSPMYNGLLKRGS
ncbi:MAG: hypothetical protein R3174_08965 [Gammaproteobacteria bacterium]|nr:hypothetical protein [Gammaproteobacteria bacterium]